jgi:hypothetical protein
MIGAGWTGYPGLKTPEVLAGQEKVTLLLLKEALLS